MARYTITPIPWGKTTGYKNLMTYLWGFGEPPIEAAQYCWLIQGDKLTCLVDTGGLPETLTMHGFPTELLEPVDVGLQKRAGVRAGDIKMVILTHLHFDHVENAKKLFPKAKYVVQKKELDGAHHEGSIQRSLYVLEHFADLDFAIVDGDTEVAEGIKVMFTPGHSSGGQSVLIDTEDGVVGISGLCTIQENYEPPEPMKSLMGVIVPGIHMDAQAAFESAKRLKAQCDLVLANHDKKWRTVSKIG